MPAVLTRASILADELGLSTASVKRLIRNGKLDYYPDRQGDYIVPGETIMKLRKVMMRSRVVAKSKTQRSKAEAKKQEAEAAKLATAAAERVAMVEKASTQLEKKSASPAI